MKNGTCTSFLQIVIILLFFGFLTSSCTHDPVNIDSFDTVCFQRDILEPLQSSCGRPSCHGANSGVEGFSVEKYETIMPFVKSGDPKGSKLYQVITNINGENFMPPDQPLSANQRNRIEIWILQGALPTTCPSNPPDTGGIPPIDWGDSVCFYQDILPIILPNCGTDDATHTCHSRVSHEGDYVLVDYTSILGGEEGVGKIIEVLTTNEPGERMPPSSRTPLSQTQINLLTRWVNEGAVESNCPDYTCDTLSALTYNNQVHLIFDNNCTINCHKVPPGEGGILLNTYGNVVTASEVMRNNASVLLGALRHRPNFKPMPSPDYQLSECSIRTIELWIENPVQGK
jgi:hypothetical protein